MKTAHPSNLEFQVLSIPWASTGSTVHEVWNQLPDGKPRACPTVLAVLQKLEQKGHVRKKYQRGQTSILPKKRGEWRSAVTSMISLTRSSTGALQT
jgi:predicted transcriptional regulator